ncbi:MAG TPA: hypothetical protein VFT40_06765 [Sphingomicrobium sp.]|nr:hypothetical protein [Sphingomicrobium sp.]
MAVGQRKSQDFGLGTPANEDGAVMIEVAHLIFPPMITGGYYLAR